MSASASADRLGEIEHRLVRLEAKVDALGPDLRVEIRTSEEETRRLIQEGDEETRRQMREGDEETRRQMREGDEETRRQMRLLHEEVIARIAILGESFPPQGPTRPRRRSGQ